MQEIKRNKKNVLYKYRFHLEFLEKKIFYHSFFQLTFFLSSREKRSFENKPRQFLYRQ